MKNLIRTLVLTGCLALTTLAIAATPADMSHTTRQLLSKLQAMGHGQHSATEWNEVIESVHDIVAKAEEVGDYDSMIEVTTILSRVYSDMLGNHAKALEVLGEMKSYAADKSTTGMPKLYLRQAEVMAKQGNEAGIAQLIEEFRKSPSYDPDSYRVNGGDAPDVPFRIERPSQAGDNSITVTGMRRALREARFAPGKNFPLEVVLGSNAARYRNKVVLLDFWQRNWSAWEADLPHLAALYQRQHANGFEIVGLPLVATADTSGMNWTQIQPSREALRDCGIAGEATNFLIDRSGAIIGRNIRGSDLASAVAGALRN